MKYLRAICSMFLVVGMIVCLASCIFDKKTQSDDFQTTTTTTSDSGTTAAPNGEQTGDPTSETTDGRTIELPRV